MTTFVDPFGITATVQGKTGIVALSVQNSPIEDIPHDCGWMVAVLTPTSDSSLATLPSGASLGDIAEVHLMPSAFTGFSILAPSGETIHGASSAQVSVGVGRLFRKIGTSVWSAIGPSDGNP